MHQLIFPIVQQSQQVIEQNTFLPISNPKDWNSSHVSHRVMIYGKVGVMRELCRFEAYICYIHKVTKRMMLALNFNQYFISRIGQKMWIISYKHFMGSNCSCYSILHSKTVNTLYSSPLILTFKPQPLPALVGAKNCPKHRTTNYVHSRYIVSIYNRRCKR